MRATYTSVWDPQLHGTCPMIVVTVITISMQSDYVISVLHESSSLACKGLINTCLLHNPFFPSD